MGRFISTGNAILQSGRHSPRKNKRCWTKKRKPQRRRKLRKSPTRSPRQNQTRRRNRPRMMAALSRAVLREARGENTKFQLAHGGLGSGSVTGNSSVDAECSSHFLCN